MEELKQVISLLSAVVSTMDTISVVGIDNQDKFVGCANAIRKAENQIRQYIAGAPSEEGKASEVTDG